MSRRRASSVNHNVALTFLVRISDGVATGVWASSVLSTYINVLEGGDDRANEVGGWCTLTHHFCIISGAIGARRTVQVRAEWVGDAVGQVVDRGWGTGQGREGNESLRLPAETVGLPSLLAACLEYAVRLSARLDRPHAPATGIACARHTSLPTHMPPMSALSPAHRPEPLFLPSSRYCQLPLSVWATPRPSRAPSWRQRPYQVGGGGRWVEVG